MAYGWGDHVGELELRVQAATEQEVFADAVRAFGELVSGEDEVMAAAEPRAIAVAGADRAALLAGLLNELVFLAETEGFVPDAMVSVALGDGALEARVRGGRGTPPHLVKAVTHH